MTMRKKAVVCLRRQNVTVGYWRNSRLMVVDHFSHSEAGHEGFERWLARIDHAECHVLLDTSDEALKLETLPHVLGTSRNAMVQRKLDQFQPGHPYKTALRMGRETTGRRDDRYLFAALTQEALLHPWLDIVERSSHPLAGIALMPVLCHRLALALRQPTDNLLFVTRHFQSLRQNHIVDGALRLSRIIASQETSPSAHLARETGKALSYLLNAQGTTSETPLHVVLAGMDTVDPEMHEALAIHPETTCLHLDTRSLAQYFSLDIDILRQEPDLLFMALIARHGCPGNLAQPQELSRLRTLHWQKRLNLASAAILASTAVAATLHASTAFHLQQEAQALSDHTRQLQAQDRPAPASVAPELSGTHLKAAVELAARIEHSYRTPLEFMQILATALDRLPEIQLDKLEWQLGETSTLFPAPDAPQFAVVEGKIHGHEAAMLNTLAEQLKAHREIENVIDERPEDSQLLRGSTQNPTTMPPRAFRLRITFRRAAS
jgi:hypothetical protein